MGKTSLLAFSTGTTIQIWEPLPANGGAREQQEQPIIIKEAGTQTAVVWSQNNRLLASAGVDGLLRFSNRHGRSAVVLWQECFDGAVVEALDAERVNSLAFRKGSDFVAAACNHGKILVWDLERQVVDKVLEHHEKAGDVTSAAYSPDCLHIASTSSRGEIVISSQSRFSTLPCPDKLPKCSVSYSDIDDLLACGSSDGSLYVWNTATQDLDQAYPQCHKGEVAAMCFLPRTSTVLVSAGSDGALLLVDRRTGARASQSSSSSALSAMACKDDGTYVSTGAIGGRVRVYDLRNIKAPLAKLQAGKAPITSMAWQHKDRLPVVRSKPSLGPSRKELLAVIAPVPDEPEPTPLGEVQQPLSGKDSESTSSSSQGKSSSGNSEAVTLVPRVPASREAWRPLGASQGSRRPPVASRGPRAVRPLSRDRLEPFSKGGPVPMPSTPGHSDISRSASLAEERPGFSRGMAGEPSRAQSAPSRLIEDLEAVGGLEAPEAVAFPALPKLPTRLGTGPGDEQAEGRAGPKVDASGGLGAGGEEHAGTQQKAAAVVDGGFLVERPLWETAPALPALRRARREARAAQLARAQAVLPAEPQIPAPSQGMRAIQSTELLDSTADYVMQSQDADASQGAAEPEWPSAVPLQAEPAVQLQLADPPQWAPAATQGLDTLRQDAHDVGLLTEMPLGVLQQQQRQQAAHTAQTPVVGATSSEEDSPPRPEPFVFLGDTRDGSIHETPRLADPAGGGAKLKDAYAGFKQGRAKAIEDDGEEVTALVNDTEDQAAGVATQREEKVISGLPEDAVKGSCCAFPRVSQSKPMRALWFFCTN